MVLVSIRIQRETHFQYGEFIGALSLGVSRTLERLVRRLKASEALTFVTIFFNILAFCKNSRN